MNISTAINNFLQQLKVQNYSNNSVLLYQNNLEILNNFYRKYFRIDGVKELNTKLVKNLVSFIIKSRNKKTGEKLKQTTIAHRLTCIKSFFNFLATEEITNDYTHLFAYKYKKRPLPTNVLTETQIKIILNLPETRTPIGYRDKVILELLYSTGMRKSEVVNLELYDIHFNAHMIRIQQGKGKKDRLVPMGQNIEVHLSKYLQEIRPKLIGKNYEEDKVFINTFGNPLKLRGIASVMERYREESGIKFSCHSFRHSFATHMIKNGSNMVLVKMILGHENLSTTEKYTRLYPRDLKKVILSHHPRAKVKEKIILPKRRRIYNIEEAKARLENKKLTQVYESNKKRAELAKTIKMLRENKELSQLKLHHKTGISQKVISRLEIGYKCEFTSYLTLVNYFQINF